MSEKSYLVEAKKGNKYDWERILAGVDPGNGHVKYCGSNFGKTRPLIFVIPSYYLRESDLSIELTKGELDVHTFEFRNRHKEIDNTVFLWGKDLPKLLEKHKKLIDRTAKEFGRYTEPEFITIAGIMFAHAMVETRRTLNQAHFLVNAGVPSKEKGTKKKPKQPELDLKQTLENNGEKWQVIVDGKLKEFTVEVREILPQARGAMYNELYTMDGLDFNLELLKLKILLLDIGAGTFTVDGLDGTKNVFKFSDYLGAKRAYEAIVKRLDERLKATKETVEQKLLDGEEVYANSKNNKDENFGKYAEEELRKLARNILSTIREYDTDFDPLNFDDIYIVGGGANLLSKYIKEDQDWKDAIVVKDPQKAIVQGYYKRLMNLLQAGALEDE